MADPGQDGEMVSECPLEENEDTTNPSDSNGWMDI